jgi:hypothetical protein
MIVLVEAFASQGTGSEGATGGEWIDAACRSTKTTKVIVITAAKREARSSKEEIYQVAQPWPDNWADYVPWKGLTYPLMLFRYLLWLRRAGSLAAELSNHAEIAISVHVSYSSLLLGTSLPRQAGKRVLAGSWVCPTPSSFRQFQPPRELLAEWLNPFMGMVSKASRRVELIAASNEAAAKAMRQLHPNTPVEVIAEPTISLIPQSKTISCVYLDREWAPRKGRHILMDCLRRHKRSPLPLQIFSARPDSWAGIDNVTAVPLATATEFASALCQSTFVLSTSWREGGAGSSVVIQAASAKAIPIVFEVVPYEFMPAECKVSIHCDGELIDNLYEALEGADKLSLDERERKANAAQRWALDITDSNKLTTMIDRWLENTSI